MSSFPGSPPLLKGNIVLLNPETWGAHRIIALQYDPDTMTRTLQIRVLERGTQ
jgi:hypothetical protein